MNVMAAEPTLTDLGGRSGLPSRAAPIIERAPLPIVEVQGTSHIVNYVNSAFCALLGKNRAELLGVPFAEIFPGAAECVPILDGVYKTGEAAAHALKDPSDANPAYWLYAMWPALDAKEQPAGVIIQLTKTLSLGQSAIAMNEALLISAVRQHELVEASEKLNAELQVEIIERQLAEAALSAAKDRLAAQAADLERIVEERTAKLIETVGELEAFSYSVAHDLRAPLRAVHGYSECLLEAYVDKLDETGKTYLQRMVRSSVRMDKLIQDVLSYTKVLGAHAPMERVSLDTLARDMIATYPDWQPPKAAIHIEGKLPDVWGNEAFLSQCVSNLVGNALKFVPPDTIPAVKIWAESLNDRMARVWFEDNGLGIAPQNHARVFRMFERIYPVNEFDGTGIGLTIVRKAVERMGGRVGFESELGKGSKFWIELPKVNTP